MADTSRIEELTSAIKYHRELYYNHSAPEISDAEFDELWDELKTIDPENPVLSEVCARTSSWNGKNRAYVPYAFFRQRSE